MNRTIFLIANQKKLPNTNPETVAITITRATYTTVFFVPNTPRITSIFGRDNDGPASSKAKAGPLPIPEANRPLNNRHFGQSKRST